MAALPQVTAELIRRLAHLEADTRVARSRLLCRLTGDPSAATAECFGEAVLLTSTAAPRAWWPNELMLAGPEHEGCLADLLDRFGARGLPPRVQTLPGHWTRPMLDVLVDRELRPEWWSTLLYRRAGGDPVGLPPGVAIEELGPGPDPTFGQVYQRGLGLWPGEPGSDLAGSLASALVGLPGWRCYLARCDGEPAAVAALCRQGELAYLAADATRPEFRRRGLQTALIRRRIADACADGCELLCVETVFGTGSQRNLEREGFQVVCTYSTWLTAAVD